MTAARSAGKNSPRSGTSSRLNIRRDAGLHLGASTSSVSHAMKPYLLGHRHGKHILDRSATLAQRDAVLSLVTGLVRDRESIMLVATDAASSRLIKGMFPMSSDPDQNVVSVVSTRWIGGTLTNRSTRLASAMEMKRKEKEAPYEISKSMRKRYDAHFRPMEPWLLSEENRRSSNKEVESLPARVFFFQANDHGVAIHEAMRSGVITAGMVNSDCRGACRKGLTYAIPGNDKRVSSTFRVASRLKEAIDRGLSQSPVREGVEGSVVEGGSGDGV